MVGGAVVPNSCISQHISHNSNPSQREKERKHTQIILVVPLEANLQVMVLGDHTEELIKQVSALTISQTVDVLHVMADSEDGFPSSHGVSANNRMLGGELAANVLGFGRKQSSISRRKRRLPTFGLPRGSSYKRNL
jgi:hypothetical protein